jgi:predicted DNA-binding transcriptional regulator AlpA
MTESMLMLVLLRLEVVLERRGSSRSRLYAAITEGLMVPPVKRGKISLWPAHEIEALNRAEIASAAPDEIRALVKQLIAQRAQARPVIRQSSECGQASA